METSYLKTLELDKIIARAAEGCVQRESHEAPCHRASVRPR